MFSIFPTDKQKQAAKALIENYNIGQRGMADGSQ